MKSMLNELLVDFQSNFGKLYKGGKEKMTLDKMMRKEIL